MNFPFLQKFHYGPILHQIIWIYLAMMEFLFCLLNHMKFDPPHIWNVLNAYERRNKENLIFKLEFVTDTKSKGINKCHLDLGSFG